MNVTISKCIQTVPPVLRNSTGGDATLVTIFYKCGKLLKLYIKIHISISKCMQNVPGGGNTSQWGRNTCNNLCGSVRSHINNEFTCD